MDPYLEDPGLWPDVHNSLIVAAREFLVRQLRPKYAVRIEERVYISGEDDPGRDNIIPDIRIAVASHQKGAKLRPGRGGPSIAEPEVLTTLLDNEIHEPYLTIIDCGSRQAVTVIEVLSPTNKTAGAEGRRRYQQKKTELLDSLTHWMEIDLLRTGAPVVPRLARPYDYVVHVSRADRRPKGYVWRIFLNQQLPVVGVPLKPEDADAPLDLQEVLTTVYDRAGYDLDINYRRPPAVPLTREQARWANQLLRSKGLR
jgi:hypothetical protein